MRNKQQSTSGSALLIIIAAMVLISVLGVALLSLNQTGSLETVVSNNNKRAYYLAESGYRYAAGLYLNTENNDPDGTADDEKNQILKDKIDGATYTLPDGGRFRLSAFPYWLFNASINGEKAVFHFPGQRPKRFGIPNEGVMAYGHPETQGELIHLFKYSGGAVAENTLTCTLGNISEETFFTPDIKSKDSIYMALLPDKNQTVSKGGSLSLALKKAKINRCIPPYNGVFIKGADNGVEYLYEKAEFKNNSVLLHNITRMDGTAFTESFKTAVTDKTFPVFKRNLALTSKGSIGSGNLASVRTIQYNVPLSSCMSETGGFSSADITVSFKSPRELADNFSPSETIKQDFWTVSEDQNVPFAKILDIAVVDGEKLGYLALKTNGHAQDTLKASWKKNNYFLEYDVQVKLASGHRLLHGGNGLCFRMQKNGNDTEYLALSFIKFHVPSLVYRHSGKNPDLTEGTLSAYKGQKKIFSGVRCLGNAETNRFYLCGQSFSHGNYPVQLEEEQRYRRVAIHPDDYHKIKDNLAELRNAELHLLVKKPPMASKTFLGTIACPHIRQSYWPAAGTSDKAFGPYQVMSGYTGDIPRGIVPLTSRLRMGSMSDWWPLSDSSRYGAIDYYNFYGKDDKRVQNHSAYKIFDCLVLVLWEQYRDAGGNIKRRWLAARDMTGDPSILGMQSTYDGRNVHNNTSLLLRLKEKEIHGVKTNCISVFYGDDAERNTGTGNNIAYDRARKRYRPGKIKWPSRSLDAWSSEKDYFTHIQAVPVQITAGNSNWDILNPRIRQGVDAPKIFELKDDGTILLSHLTSPGPDADGNVDWGNRPEVGFHAFGGIGAGGGKHSHSSMCDFALRLVNPGNAAGHLSGGFRVARQH